MEGDTVVFIHNGVKNFSSGHYKHCKRRFIDPDQDIQICYYKRIKITSTIVFQLLLDLSIRKKFHQDFTRQLIL